MDDTPAEIKIIYNDMLLSKSPLERLRMTSRMYDSAKKLATSGILMEKKHLDTSRLRGELFLRFYGDCFSSAEMKQIVKEIPNMQLDASEI